MYIVHVEISTPQKYRSDVATFNLMTIGIQKANGSATALSTYAHAVVHALTAVHAYRFPSQVQSGLYLGTFICRAHDECICDNDRGSGRLKKLR